MPEPSRRFPAPWRAYPMPGIEPMTLGNIGELPARSLDESRGVAILSLPWKFRS
jgi:hypothetical protein